MTSFLTSLRILPGPIFAVELVTSTRRSRYFLLRVIYATILLCFLFIIGYSTFRQQEPSIGEVANFTASFFSTFGTVQLLAVLLMGPAMVAGAIAIERERRTIEYLFTTTLSNSEIILGKLTARLLQVFGLVLAGVPVLSLAMLMGGISPDALLVLMLITASTMLTVAMLSIAVSVWSTRARTSVIRAYLLLFLLFITPLLAAWLNQLHRAPILVWIQDEFLAANPIVAFMSTTIAAGPPGANHDPWLILGHLALNQMIVAVTSLVWATFAVRRVHLRQSGKAERTRRFRLQLFRGSIGTNPMLWKEMFARTAASRLGLLGYAVLAIIFTAVIGISADVCITSLQRSYSGPMDGYGEYAMTMGTFLGCGGLLLLAARAAGCLTSEKERDCWDSLLATPLEPNEIIRAKMLGNLWSIRGLLFLLAIVWIPATYLAPMAFLGAIFSGLVLMLIAVFASVLGVSASLKAKNSLRAMGKTMGICLFLGGGYLMCCSMCCFPMITSAGPLHDIEWIFGIIFAPCIPFLLGFPIMAAMGHGRSSSDQVGLFLGLFIGIFGYAISACAIYASMIRRFDEFTGRTRPSGRMPRPAGAPPVLAMVVSESPSTATTESDEAPTG